MVTTVAAPCNKNYYMLPFAVAAAVAVVAKIIFEQPKYCDGWMD